MLVAEFIQRDQGIDLRKDQMALQRLKEAVEKAPQTEAPKEEAPKEEKTTAPEAADAAPAEEAPAEEAPAAEEVVEVTEEERKPAVEMPHRDLKTGMVVRVHETIKDTNSKGQERERVQVFEGTILGFAGSGIGRTMTVRKVSKGFGVEKIYPLASPHVAKVEVVKQLRARRSKMWFLRKGKTKRRIKEIPLDAPSK